MTGGIELRWRGQISDDEVNALTRSHGGHAEAGWWDRIRPHSLGWVTARLADGTPVGFANVAWDGGDHAFLLDPKAHGDHQRRGIGTAVVRLAVEHAREAGCEWLHVDFDAELAAFYLGACGFRATPAGRVHLRPPAPPDHGAPVLSAGFKDLFLASLREQLVGRTTTASGDHEPHDAREPTTGRPAVAYVSIDLDERDGDTHVAVVFRHADDPTTTYGWSLPLVAGLDDWDDEDDKVSDDPVRLASMCRIELEEDIDLRIAGPPSPPGQVTPPPAIAWLHRGTGDTTWAR